MVAVKKQKKSAENINSRLSMVMKSGKYCLGYKQTLKSLRSGKAKLVIIASNTPALRKSEIEYYAMLAKTGVHHYNGNNIELGTACGKLFRVCTLAVTDPGDSDIMARDPVRRKPFIIGVAGGTASGKSLVTAKIFERLAATETSKQVVTLSLESFYRDLTLEEQKKVWTGDYDFDHPGAFKFAALADAIQSLQNGEPVKVGHYDFVDHCKKGDTTIEPADVIIVEGILVFYDERVRKLMDMKLFVDADADIRLARRVERDTVERMRDLNHVLKQYIGKVKPAFEEFCLPTKKYADVIIPRGGENDVAIDLLVQHIQELVRTPRGSPEASVISASPRPMNRPRPH
ncbi:hypothetical protein PRIPAC_71193 [Pristionchus pacificus]|uniref:Large ribosomal subunit protein eL30 n=1 Tax=Pristionchus pacificus TaxID=54126 RepID=A0A2A6CZV4_PRIPA|nr:hypothetical protein PRIPAC_71193 [Pristionchus pacificus]|eukprot:PDM83561.1 ribosomal protein [Pristionchus pacificus]